MPLLKRLVTRLLVEIQRRSRPRSGGALISVPPSDRATLRRFFLPERPGPQTALQALREPRDACYVDRWPEPRAVVIVAPTDMVLAGDPSALRPADLRALAFKGMIEAPPEFVPLLEATYSDLRPWPRIVGTLEGGSPPPVPAGVVVRRLVAGDETLARTLHKSGSWVWKHYRDTDAMVASGQAWAAIAEGKCVSVAAPFTRGDLYEDIATFTDPDFRGMGLSTACKGRLIEDVKSRGHVTSVGNGRTNLAVHRVNARLGYRKHRDDVLYVTGIKTP